LCKLVRPRTCWDFILFKMSRNQSGNIIFVHVGAEHGLSSLSIKLKFQGCLYSTTTNLNYLDLAKDRFFQMLTCPEASEANRLFFLELDQSSSSPILPANRDKKTAPYS
jgi:hypothetical protein